MPENIAKSKMKSRDVNFGENRKIDQSGTQTGDFAEKASRDEGRNTHIQKKILLTEEN